MFAPLRNGFGFAVDCQSMVVALIPLLVLVRRPAAVIGRVTFAVVDAINCCLLEWQWKHVAGKSLKRAPFIADGNSPAAIIWVIAGVFVVTALNYAAPDIVPASFTLSMSQVRFARGFTSDAPTTFSLTESEINPWNIFSFAAIALAFLYRAPVFVNPSQRKNDKSAETHTEIISPYSTHFEPLCFIRSEDSITLCDKGIRKHAAVVDLYENLRQKCSAPISPPQPEEKP